MSTVSVAEPEPGQVAIPHPPSNSFALDSAELNSDPFHDYPQLKDQYVPYVEPGYVDRSVRYLLSSRRSISSAVSLMGERMDAYFAGEQYVIEENNTYLRLRLSQKWIEGGHLEPEMDYKFRLDLPGTKERYRLVLAYQEDNEQSLEERTIPSEAAGPPQEQSLFAGLLRTLGDVGGDWETKLSAGIKVKLPPDPFVRAVGKRFASLGELWEFELRSGVEWFNSSGVHAETDFIFERLVGENLLFRSATLFDWRDEDDTLEFGQKWSLYDELSPRDAIAYHLGVYGNSYSHSRINTYFISADYRRDLYKDWLYMNLVPELAFPRKEGFSGVASITVSFEIFFR
ncbi:MAG: hypothetical protein CMK83_07125 [Pseudomonadales bacterium]|nr:hypothetical protein [Pseudomonadales bacterium]HAG96564.1 hypothetical protein [Gammaproteobacteria bacterium]HAU14590.1 hypothetical protein [Gammaproteobacteria bacterium]HBO91674.1 hypothetical protein [Gammaproteobacteria bacterium]|tara:strand:+ start:896 stop:1924 length:1029 start_codon:yes stop_codon:yes gene_type:complete